ncbi:MAG: helix-turn-helix domain containing protein [Opitutaceae bacterium]|nr:helix-turn-helix domain containing protein [Opitutaceae bacterium]
MWLEFVERAEKGEQSFSALCAHYGVSRKTGYKWLRRFRELGVAGLEPRSRRPRTSPRKTPLAVVELIVRLRRENPHWSGPRLRQKLRERGVTPVPAVSTIDLILRRRRLPGATDGFELAADPLPTEANYRWRLCLGPVLRFADGVTAQPAMVHDEATDFMVGAGLLANPSDSSLVPLVERCFRRHGVPWRFAVTPEAPDANVPVRRHTAFTIWLMRVGVLVDFVAPVSSAPPVRDPLEHLARSSANFTCGTASVLLEQLRDQHNFCGSGESPQRHSPIALYRPSLRELPPVIPPPAYPPQAAIRLVSEKGTFTFQRQVVQLGRAFSGLEIELRSTPDAKSHRVFFVDQYLGRLERSEAESDETRPLNLRPD